jgi:hypothetical protein
LRELFGGERQICGGFTMVAKGIELNGELIDFHGMICGKIKKQGD